MRLEFSGQVAKVSENLVERWIGGHGCPLPGVGGLHKKGNGREAGDELTATGGHWLLLRNGAHDALNDDDAAVNLDPQSA